MPLEPPSVDVTYTSIDSAFRALQRHAKSQGYALVKVRPCNYDPNGIPRRYDIACACGSRKHASSSTGVRKCRTRKTGCPFKMKVVQKRLFGDVWIPIITCGEHNHGPEDPAKFPEHRLGSLRRRHFEKIKTLAEEGKNCRAIREVLQVDEPSLLVNDSDIGNILRELKAMEEEGEPGEEDGPGRRRRHRRLLNISDDEEEDLLDRQEVEAQEAARVAAEQESELHKTLLALVPRIVQETIAAMPSAMPPQVAAVAAAATARLRDVARQQQPPPPHHQQPQQPPYQQPQPQQGQQLQLPAAHNLNGSPQQADSTLRSVAPTSANHPSHLGFGMLVPGYSNRS